MSEEANHVSGDNGSAREKFFEYRVVTSSEPLRQGDVLESVDPNASMWERYLVVLTADCDFAHQKHLGRVTCIPLLTKDEYLFELHVPRLLTRHAKKPVTILRDLLNELGPVVGDARIREWAGEEEPETIVETLRLTGADREKALAALTSLRLLDQPLTSLSTACRAIVEAQLACHQPPKHASAIKELRSDLANVFTSPPGDALFISAIGPRSDEGYFAYLRHVVSIDDAAISVGPNRGDVAHRRIARLEDRFIHALALRFATVFMSIGLPDEYEEMRDLHSSVLIEEIVT